MATVFSPACCTLSFQSLRLITRTSPITLRRALSTLPNNQHIYVHNDPNSPSKQRILSLLPNEPPIPSLAIGTTSQVPITPESLKENHEFLDIVQNVISEHAVEDPDVQAQAAMYASQAGSALGSGGTFFLGNHPSQQRQRNRRQSSTKQYGGGGGAGGDGAGGASAQGGMGGAGRGGYIHVSDQRNPPDFGRVAWPEDIFGSLEIDGSGQFTDGTGRYQRGGTYRICTNEGILGLSTYLRQKVVEKLQELDAQARKNA